MFSFLHVHWYLSHIVFRRTEQLITENVHVALKGRRQATSDATLEVLAAAYQLMKKQRRGRVKSTDITPTPLVHLVLPFLPTGQLLVVDLDLGILSLVQHQPACVLMNHTLTPNAMRLLILLLKSPNYCPFEYLIAALQAPEEVFRQVLLTPSLYDRAIPEIVLFHTLVEDYTKRIDLAVPGKEREWYLRQMRRFMTEVIAGVKHFDLSVFTLRTCGYGLQHVTSSVRLRPISARTHSTSVQTRVPLVQRVS